MKNNDFPKYMWVILIICVAVVTIIGLRFGIKALMIVAALGLVGILILDHRS